MNTFKLWSMMLLMILGSAISISAQTHKVTLEWGVPGAVKIQMGSPSAEFVELVPDATSLDVEFSSPFQYVYLTPAEGYILTSFTKKSDGSAKNSSLVGTAYSLLLNSSLYDDTVVIEAVKPNRDKTLTINVENGASLLSGKFTETGFPVTDLKKGANTIHFDPTYEKNISLSVSSGKIFKLTAEGADVDEFYGTFRGFNNVTPGAVLNVRVFENDEDEVVDNVTLNVKFVGTDESCINTIYNWTARAFVNLADGKLELAKNTDIAFNFKDGYDFTSFTLNDEELTYNAKRKQVRFVVKEDATLTITAKEKEYGTVNYTAYVTNPEGVGFTYSFEGTDDVPSTSEAITSDVTIPGFVLPASSTKKLTLAVSEKTPKFFIAPKDGWYVKTVMSKSPDTNKIEVLESAVTDETAPSHEIYVIAEKYEMDAAVDFNVISDNPSNVRLRGNSSLLSWSNPSKSFTLTAGEQTIDFIAGYHNPFTLNAIDAPAGFAVYVDGLSVSADDNGLYALDIYTGTDGRKSLVKVFGDGKTKPQTGNVTFTCNGNATAAVTYSNVDKAATGSKLILLNGTPVRIIPSEGAELTVNGTKVNLTDGAYTFNVDGDAEVVVGAPVSADIEFGIDPADKSTVKTLKQFYITLPFDETAETMFIPSEATAKRIVIAKDGATVVNAEDITLGEMESIYDAMYQTIGIKFPVNFPEIKEAGTYTVTFPEGTIFEADFEMNVIANGKKSAEKVISYTVDPEMKTAVEVFHFTPQDGSEELEAIEYIFLHFPQIPAMNAYMINNNQVYDDVTLTRVDTPSARAAEPASYICDVNPYDEDDADGTSYDYARMVIQPVDDINYEPVKITAGKWRLDIPSSKFTHNGYFSPAMSAVFAVKNEASGIEGIDSGSAATVTVYSLDGRVLLDGAPASAIGSLENGLYIVNGKKVLINK